MEEDQIVWCGEPIKGHPNRRRLSREQTAKLTVAANLNGTSRSIDVWVLWANLTVLTSGMGPRTPLCSLQVGAMEPTSSGR